MQTIPDDSLIFTNLVKEWILHALTSGATRFDQLLLTLPSVYPSVALNALWELAEDGKVERSIFTNALCQVTTKPSVRFVQHHPTLPIPHPLDFDWRFTHQAVDYLLSQLFKLTDLNDCIALLGTPSILWWALEQSFPRQLVLLDSNTTMTDYLAHIVSNTSVVHNDLTHDILPLWHAKAIVIDPPWYTSYIKLFLWAAAQLCVVGGYILASLPPIGTRPGIEREWATLLEWTQELGLVLLQLDEARLPYISPPFERNALSAEGISNIPSEWRRGNLAIFILRSHTNVPRPPIVIHKSEWVEEIVYGVRIALRCQQETNFEDPSLISIIPEDILPSVSTRDRRRQNADVWTSGNRIFACRGRNILQQILHAIGTEQSPFDAISALIKRPLELHERALIATAIRRIMQIIALERAELMVWGYSVDQLDK